MRAALSLAIGAALLAACGGDNNQTQQPPTDSVNYSQLQATPQNTAPLVLVDGEKLSQHLKNGMRLQLKDRGYYAGGGSGSSSGAPVPTTGEVADSSSKGGFSETNVHVAGVDEADYAKYDGSHWFIATYPQYYAYDQQSQQPGFQIVATDPATPDAEIVGAFEFDDEVWGDVSSLYLVKEGDTTSHVAALRNQWGNVYPTLPGFPINLAIAAFDGAAVADAIFWPGPRNSKVRVQLVNVTTPSAPAQDWEIELDGSLIDSRKIGETLYLITRYDPWLDTLQYEYGDSTVRDRNEATLASVKSAELLPQYRIGDVAEPLTVDCFVQEGLKDTYGLGSLVHITAIDLAGQKVLGSTCLNSNVEVMSMSLDALYLTGTVYDGDARGQNTVIHKFSLAAAGPSYEATGSVPGSMGWQSDPVFRIHEHEGQLRIVTSGRDENGPTHQLTILEQNADRLSAISTLPNSTRPDPIGKPGEDIYAVRFQSERAYVVTFQRTDPLYTLDLSDPTDPKVAGELEIPGFATYMHPIGEQLLFTLGHSADEGGRVNGVKVDLFDVAGDAPKLINSIRLGDSSSYSEALNNLRALSFMQNGADQLRIALPLSSYSDTRGSITGLKLLEVNGIAMGEPALVDAGMVAAADPEHGFFRAGIDRGILHDDAVFYTHNNAVWVANWDDPENAKGPITKDPIICPAVVLPSLRVQVISGERTSEVDMCDATVTASQGDERYVLEPARSTALVADMGGCVFSGPLEVPGLFDVHIAMEGYLPQSINGVFVPKGICNVQTQELQTVLKPE